MLTWAIPERRNAGFGLLPIHHRLMTLGLSRSDARKLVSLICRWYYARGPKGYLVHIARIKTAFTNREIGCVTSVPGLSLTRKGLPRQVGFLSLLNLGNRFRVLKLMKNLIKYDEVQPEQWEKFYCSATRPQPDKEWLKHYSGLCTLGSMVYPNQDVYSYAEPTPVTELPDEFGNKTFARFGARTSEPRTPEAVLQDSLLAARAFIHLKPVVPGFVSTYPVHEASPRTAGMIGVTQEPGGKARFFVSAHPVWQASLTPLQAALKYRAYRDPGGFVRSQDAGRELVARVLKRGKKVFTFDLSDATNVFPLRLQTDWMYKSGLNPQQVDRFGVISMTPYTTCQEIYDKFGVSEVTFTVGQPLGLLPSALAFHLTHVYLLRGLELSLYGNHRNMFAVLVDDVCIWDETLANEYRLACERLGITISESKSFVSDRFSEFLGRVIEPGRCHEITSMQPVTFENVLQYARIFGRKVVKEFPSKARHFLNEVISLPSPLGANCGDGRPLTVRLNSSIGRIALVEGKAENRKVRPMGCVTSRTRAILKLARMYTGISLSPELRTYLSRLLPRRRSKVPVAHYCHPTLGLLFKGSECTLERYTLESSSPAVLVRKPPEYDSLRSWREPNFSSAARAFKKNQRQYLERCFDSFKRGNL